ncbi:MAG: hypothetical protein ACXWDC_07865 [Aeromicrobium sp.]
MRIDSGMPLPDRLVEALAAGAEAGIVAFLSETCWDLAGELGRFRGGPVLAFFAGHVSGAMRSRLGEGVAIADPAVGRDVSEELRINMTPVVVLHQDGFIVGSAVGEGAESVAALDKLWKITVSSKGGSS